MYTRRAASTASDSVGSSAARSTALERSSSRTGPRVRTSRTARRERGHVTRRDEQRGVADHRGGAADVGRDHRRAGEQCLLEPHRLALPAGAGDDDVGGTEQVGDVVAGSEQPHREGFGVDAALERRPQRPVPGDHGEQVEVGELGESVEEQVEPLLRGEARHDDDERGPRVDPEVGVHGVAVANGRTRHAGPRRPRAR